MKRWFDIGVAAVFAFQIALAAILVPTVGGGVAFPNGSEPGVACLLRGTFGIECPMCGMTRSFVALTHGDIGASFGFHPAGPILFAFMVFAVLVLGAAAIRRSRPMFERPMFRRAFGTIAIASVLMGIGRTMLS